MKTIAETLDWIDSLPLSGKLAMFVITAAFVLFVIALIKHLFSEKEEDEFIQGYNKNKKAVSGNSRHGKHN